MPYIDMIECVQYAILVVAVVVTAARTIIITGRRG